MALTVGVREFRQDLADYIDGDEPVTVTRHGRRVGVFIPTRGDRAEAIAAYQAATEKLHALMAEQGMTRTKSWPSSTRRGRRVGRPSGKSPPHRDPAAARSRRQHPHPGDARREGGRAPDEVRGVDRVLRAMRTEALQRIGRRDPDDWPIVAAALALDCPIWTEDRDFFGAGVATWTSELVEIYLRNDG